MEVVARSIEHSLQYLRRQLASEIEPQEAVRIEGALQLQRTKLRFLSGNLDVDGDLLLTACQRLRGFRSQRLKVGGDLCIGGPSATTHWLGETEAIRQRYGNRVAQFLSRASTDTRSPFEAWPEKVEVGGSVRLVNCDRCKQLPDSFSVAQSLELINCGISWLPSDLVINGDLVLVGCPIEWLPAGLTVRGNLTLGNLPLRELPHSLNVGGTLKIAHCANLHAVRQSVSVGRSLRIVRSGVREIAPELVIPDYFSIRNCPVESLTLPRCSDIAMAKCPSLRKIELAMPVQKFNHVRVVDCESIESLPDGMMIERGCQLTDLPKLRRLPVKFVSRGIIDIAGTELEGVTEEQMGRLRFRHRSVPIPAYALFDPERLSVHDVLNQTNAEVRRMMLERMGVSSFEKQMGRLVIDRDTDAGGSRSLIRFSGRAYLLCRCPSTARAYLLGVPSTVSSCRAAAAWLAGFDNPQDYSPLIET